MKTSPTPEMKCLYCGKAICAATGEGEPRPGSLSVCIRCGAVSKFADDLTLRAFTASEERALLADENTMSLLRKIAGAVRLISGSRN